MANIRVHATPTAQDKLNNMQQLAAFDVSDDDARAGCQVPNLDGIRAPVGPPKVPKMYLNGTCAFNCAYCGCRASRDMPQDLYTPDEVAGIAVQCAQRGGHGVFLSSAIYRCADYTQELIIESLKKMRFMHGYHGYIHAKIMPGADPRLIEQTGWLADRMSVNIEVARSEGYARVAHQKTKDMILRPMADIAALLRENEGRRGPYGRAFARSGHTTQLMPGSTGEDDRTIVTLSHALYHKFGLRRVYYSPFQYSHPARGYDLPPANTPQWRGARLYQADFLMKQYGFTPDELLPERHPFLESDLDPKCAWALRNAALFPVELNTAPYETLIRVPGIGTTYARKIIEVRKSCRVTFDVLAKIGVPLKRAVYFITCAGTYRGGRLLGEPLLRDKLAVDIGAAQKHRQISFFDSVGETGVGCEP